MICFLDPKLKSYKKSLEIDFFIKCYLPQQRLYLFPLPQAHVVFLPILLDLFGSLVSLTKSISAFDGILKVNDVFPLLLVTAKSPKFIISIPIKA